MENFINNAGGYCGRYMAFAAVVSTVLGLGCYGDKPSVPASESVSSLGDIGTFDDHDGGTRNMMEDILAPEPETAVSLDTSGRKPTPTPDSTVGSDATAEPSTQCGDSVCQEDENSCTCPPDCPGDNTHCLPVPTCDKCGECGNLDCWLWYSPSNAAVAGGKLPDFFEVFDDEESWSDARSRTGVFFMRKATLGFLKDTSFIEDTLAPALQKWKMRLALDVGAATWAKCLDNPDAKLAAEKELIHRIEDAGVHVEFLAMQSILSKPLPSPLPENLQANCPPYTMEDRYEDVLWYISAMKTEFPDAKIGLIDASLAHGEDAQAIYSALAAHLAASGEQFDFVLFDHPYHHGETEGVKSWASLAQLEVFVREVLKTPTGIYHVSSTGGKLSEKQFFFDVINSYENYAAAGGTPSFHVVTSWYLYPSHELPETADAPSYPLTKALRHIGKKIELANQSPMGHLGAVAEDGLVTGWTLDEDNPALSIRVNIYVDGPMGEGVSIGQFMADIPRPDVNAATGLPGDHGYSVPLPAWLDDGQPHDIYVYGVDSRALGEPSLLFGAPMSYNSPL